MARTKLMWLQLFLHFADVSNPLHLIGTSAYPVESGLIRCRLPRKPFHICRAWAWRVLDEFFEQGDEENGDHNCCW